MCLTIPININFRRSSALFRQARYVLRLTDIGSAPPPDHKIAFFLQLLIGKLHRCPCNLQAGGKLPGRGKTLPGKKLSRVDLPPDVFINLFIQMPAVSRQQFHVQLHAVS